MRYDKRTRQWWYALVVGMQFVALWVAVPVGAGIESYDPRLDPNYTRATPGNPGLDWRTIEALGREFQERSAAVSSRPTAGGYYAPPQPWHYVGAAYPAMVPQTDYAGYGYWAPPVGGLYPYWYGFGVYGWREPYPRIPWWSLVPPRHHHRPWAHSWSGHRRHDGMTGHRGW